MNHRKNGRNTPYLTDGELHRDNQPTGIQIDTSAWFDFLDLQQPFYFAGQHGTLHARPEKRREKWYWYAYRHLEGKSKKKYLGKAESITLVTLQRVCGQLNRAFI